MEEAVVVGEEATVMYHIISQKTMNSSINRCTFSPIGDISFLLTLRRSVSPINSPIESPSRRIRTNFGCGMLPSVSLMICLSVPSRRKGKE